MRTIGPAVSEKKIFEIVDDGRDAGAWVYYECQTTRTQDDSDPKFLGRLGPKPFRTQDESDPNLFGPKTNRTHTDGRYTDDIINAWYPPGPRGSWLQMTLCIILNVNRTHKTSEQSLLRNYMYNGTTNSNTNE